MRKLFKIAILLLLLSQSDVYAIIGKKTEKVTDSINFSGVLGTYANPPCFENGSVDFYRLISELKDIHADTYNWLIYQDPNAWNDLKKFLPLARLVNQSFITFRETGCGGMFSVVAHQHRIGCLH